MHDSAYETSPSAFTMKPLLALLLFLALGTAGVPALAEAGARISLEQLETMFAKIRSETKWNADGPLTWNYFFKHQELARLEMAAMHLERAGYEVAGMGKIQGQPAFRLRVKKSRHTRPPRWIRATPSYTTSPPEAV